MSFLESIRSVLSKYATFTGRARRSEFWWYYLAYTVVFLALYVITAVPAAAAVSAQSGATETSPLAIVASVLLLVFVFGLLVPTIAVTVRRLHDTDRSGFFYFLGFIPLVGGIIMLVLLAGSGTSGPNRFGPDPKVPAELPAQA